jgi:hypothetical protein
MNSGISRLERRIRSEARVRFLEAGIDFPVLQEFADLSMACKKERHSRREDQGPVQEGM